jgi:hypothetical protein
MVNKMTNQNYLTIENLIVTNIVLWDGNTDTWTPPSDATMLIQATTPAIVWTPIFVDNVITNFELTEVIGAGAIGFIWNGSVVTTNQPKP